MIQQRRGKNVALAGAFFQLVFTAVMLVIWLWTRSAAAMSCLWFLIGGLGVWLMAALLLYCRQIERRESLELEEIAAGGGADGTIFAGDAEREMRVAARRLRIVERWGVPLFALFWAAYHVATGLLMLQYLRTHQGATIQAAGEGALFLVLIAFLAFLFSFYALGMGRRPQWRVLRAAGSYVLINVLLIAAVAGNLLAAWQGYSGADRALACAIPALQLIFALELAANVILDLYRPRVPGQEERFSFDSRIFGLIADPQRVGTSIAETLNYQFGFEVSKTWFYRVVSRAFVPLVLFGLVVLVGLSSVLVVREGEAFVVQRWGRADPARGALGPGLHLKWPVGVEDVRYFDNRLIVYEIESREIISKDKKTLVIDNYVEWRIVDPLLFLKSVGNNTAASLRIDDIVYSSVRNVLGKNEFSQIISERRMEIIDEITKISTKKTEGFGVEIVDVRIKRAELPEENRNFVFRRMDEERKKQANRYRSEGEMEAATIKSQADYEQQVVLAKAYKESKEIHAESEAKAAKIFSAAYSKDPEFYKFYRGLQALKTVVDESTTMVLSDDMALLGSLK